MASLLKILGRTGLFLTIFPSILYLMDVIPLGTVKGLMLVGTILWLVSAPIIQKLNKQPAD